MSGQKRVRIRTPRALDPTQRRRVLRRIRCSISSSEGRSLGLRPKGIIFLPSRSGRSRRGKAPGISNTRTIYPCEKAEVLLLLVLLVVAPSRLGVPSLLRSRHFLLVLESACLALDRVLHIKRELYFELRMHQCLAQCLIQRAMRLPTSQHL